MRPPKKIRFKAPDTTAKIEFDSSVGAWYIRFRNVRVAKTVSEESPGMVMAIDLDANDELIGIELIGAKEFSIQEFKKWCLLTPPKWILTGRHSLLFPTAI